MTWLVTGGAGYIGAHVVRAMVQDGAGRSLGVGPGVYCGQSACDSIRVRVDGVEPTPCDLPPARLVVRDSTGPAPATVETVHPCSP